MILLVESATTERISCNSFEDSFSNRHGREGDPPQTATVGGFVQFSLLFFLTPAGEEFACPLGSFDFRIRYL